MRNEEAPAGTRILFKGYLWGDGLSEATVKEWSPSGKCVKIAYEGGGCQWLSDYDTDRLEIIGNYIHDSLVEKVNK
jgi:hypothetical protein